VSQELCLGDSTCIKASAFKLHGQRGLFLGSVLLLQDAADNQEVLQKVRSVAKQLLALSKGNSLPTTCDNLATLTEREQEVFELLGEGLKNRAIAKLLNITESTVKKHISSILRKLNISSRTEVALLVAQNGRSS